MKFYFSFGSAIFWNSFKNGRKIYDCEWKTSAQTKVKSTSGAKKQRNSEKGKLRQWFHDSIWTHFECTEATSLFIWYLSFTLNLSISRSFPLSIPLGFILCLFLFALMPGKVFAFFRRRTDWKKGAHGVTHKKNARYHNDILCSMFFIHLYYVFTGNKERERENIYMFYIRCECVRDSALGSTNPK